MSQDAVIRYQQSMENLTKQTEAIRRMRMVIKFLNDANWENLMISNVSAGFPMEIAMNRNIPSLDARDWPTAEIIATAIAGLHSARKQAITDYEAIPEGLRAMISAPVS